MIHNLLFQTKLSGVNKLFFKKIQNYKFFFGLLHGMITWTGITCKKKSSLLNSAWLWSRARPNINTKQKYFSLPDHQLGGNLIFFLDFTKGQKRNKRKFMTNFVGISYFHLKMSLKHLVKPLLHSDFPLTTWNTKL